MNKNDISPFSDFRMTKGSLRAQVCCDASTALEWDAFAARSPYGHFYQASAWGRVRMLDGWNPLIIVITNDGQIVGGFQLLWRSKSVLGRIGIILKGPLAESDNLDIVDFSLSVFKNFSKEHKFRVLIIQPPDGDDKVLSALSNAGFSHAYLGDYILTNTVSIDLQVSEDDLFKRIKRIKRQNINTAIRRGITVRKGDKSNLDQFFAFMSETCKRQKVAPNPSSAAFLHRLWDLFTEQGKIEIFLAELEGEVINSLIVIPFGQTAFLWKFGWSGMYPKYHPNMLIYWEIFKWAKSNGFKRADLGAIDSNLAEQLLKGESATEEMSKTYSYFKVGFGGKVVPLSNGFIFITNPIIRSAYNLLMPFINSRPSLKKKFLFSE